MKCVHCKGTGTVWNNQVDVEEFQMCPACNGVGRLKAGSVVKKVVYEACIACDGTGKRPAMRPDARGVACFRCGGSGSVPSPGPREGEELRAKAARRLKDVLDTGGQVTHEQLEGLGLTPNDAKLAQDLRSIETRMGPGVVAMSLVPPTHPGMKCFMQCGGEPGKDYRRVYGRSTSSEQMHLLAVIPAGTEALFESVKVPWVELCFWRLSRHRPLGTIRDEDKVESIQRPEQSLEERLAAKMSKPFGWVREA